MSRLEDGPLRRDDEGLRGAWTGTFVLALEAVSERLGTVRSGVCEVTDGACSIAPGADGDNGSRIEPRTDPTDETDASEVADAIAESIGDQSSPDAFVFAERACSLDTDFLS